MTNEFTPFIFVYSNNENDLDIYNNDISKANRYNNHITQIYKGTMSAFSYDEGHGGYTMPDSSIGAKMFCVTGGIESNMVIGSGADIQNYIASLSTGISNRNIKDLYMAVYVIGDPTLPTQTTISGLLIQMI